MDGTARLFNRVPMKRRDGFTLLELLVVVGIIALLLAILLPTISGMRGAARRTVCSSRLRDLSLACLNYRQDFGRFFPPQADAIPHQIELRLLNQLASYLRYPTIEPSTRASSLPVSIQCPFVEDVELDRGPAAVPRPDETHYYTGYMYLAGLEQIAINRTMAELDGDSTSIAVLLKPERAARAIESRRAVIWADDLHLTLEPTVGWEHSHPFGRLVPEAFAFAGQHRAYTDASVEWCSREQLELELEPQALSINDAKGKGRKRKLEEAASFRLGDRYYWWF